MYVCASFENSLHLFINYRPQTEKKFLEDLCYSHDLSIWYFNVVIEMLKGGPNYYYYYYWLWNI